jgi:hypothetical protein
LESNPIDFFSPNDVVIFFLLLCEFHQGGRAMGDLYIATAGFIDLRNILNLLVIPAACYMGISIGLIYQNYDLLAV